MTTDDVPDGTLAVPGQNREVGDPGGAGAADGDGQDRAAESLRLARRQVELLEEIRQLLLGTAPVRAGVPGPGSGGAAGPGSAGAAGPGSGGAPPTQGAEPPGTPPGPATGSSGGQHAADVRAALVGGQPVPLRLGFAPADYLELHRWAGDEGTTPAELVRRALANERFLEQQVAAGYRLYLQKRNIRRRVLLNGGRP